MSTQRTITLGIEMSNPSARDASGSVSHSVAIWDDGGTLLGSAPLPDSARGSDAVLHAIAKLSELCDVQAHELARIIVSIGPGGYTALRIATTSAKVLADTLGAELIPVPTPLVASIGVPVELRPAAIVLAAKKERGHVSVLREDGCLETLGVIDVEALDQRSLRSVVADQHLPGSFREFAEAREIPISVIQLDAQVLLKAAEGISSIDPLRLEPIYAREPDAVTQWRARGSG